MTATKSYFGKTLGEYTAAEAIGAGLGYLLAIVGAVLAITASHHHRTIGWLLIGIGIVVGLVVTVIRSRRLRSTAN
jgi:hypothetical protein